MNKSPEEHLAALVTQCAYGVMTGQATVTISTTSKLPAGFPKCELLSVGTDGSHNYAAHPVKVLAWVHGRTLKKTEAQRAGTGPTGAQS